MFVFSHGYAFLAASQLTGDLTKIHDLIEDVIAQADEVDETYLQVSYLPSIWVMPFIICLVFPVIIALMSDREKLHRNAFIMNKYIYLSWHFFQFEGGLYTTATVIDGAYKLAVAAKKAPTLTEVSI